MLVEIQEFLKDESGAEIPAYLVVLGVLLAIGVPLLMTIGGHIRDIGGAIIGFLIDVKEFITGG